MDIIKQLKIYGFDARTAGEDEIAIQFRIANVKGIGKVISAFNNAKKDITFTGLLFRYKHRILFSQEIAVRNPILTCDRLNLVNA